MAEWLKALVLKTRDGNIRRFESCPFRHQGQARKLAVFLSIVSNLEEESESDETATEHPSNERSDRATIFDSCEDTGVWN